MAVNAFKQLLNFLVLTHPGSPGKRVIKQVCAKVSE